MATITQMRKVFIHATNEFWYIVPIEMKDEFYHLLLQFFNDKTEANKKAFLDKFEYYQRVNEPPALEVYVIEKGIYDKRNEGLDEPSRTA